VDVPIADVARAQGSSSFGDKALGSHSSTANYLCRLAYDEVSNGFPPRWFEIVARVSVGVCINKCLSCKAKPLYCRLLLFSALSAIQGSFVAHPASRKEARLAFQELEDGHGSGESWNMGFRLLRLAPGSKEVGDASSLESAERRVSTRFRRAGRIHEQHGGGFLCCQRLSQNPERKRNRCVPRDAGWKRNDRFYSAAPDHLVSDFAFSTSSV
jgi:hypothetical protein